MKFCSGRAYSEFRVILCNGQCHSILQGLTLTGKISDLAILNRTMGTLKGAIKARRQKARLKKGALQSAIFNSPNFSIIAIDTKGVIQIFNVDAERMLNYAAADVMHKSTPADISDTQEVIAGAKALSAEFGIPIMPGFEALGFKASRGSTTDFARRNYR